MFKRFCKDVKGNVSLTIAGILPLLLGVVGGAVDFSKMSAHREGLQAALDSTILAAATGKFGPVAKLDKAAAESYLNNVATAAGLNIDPATLDFDIGRVADKTSFAPKSNDKKAEEFMVWGTASAPVDTYFLKMFNSMLKAATANASSSSSAINKVAAYSEAFASTRKNLEIVLVLDNTGSMGSRHKMDILKQATLNFVDEIEDLTKYNKTNWVKMGLVPFTTQIRFDARYKNDGWVGFENKDHKNGWSGCLWDRAAPFDANVSYDGSEAQKFTATDDYYVYGQRRVEKHCTLAHSVPLLENLGRIRGGINSMKADGYTNVGLGLVWGWNFLDPSEPFTEGVAYDDEETIKILILLTDGDNTFNRRGYKPDANTWSSAFEDTHTKEACDNLKFTSIQVYTIRVVDGNQDLLKNCATQPNMFYDVRDPKDMIGVFYQIAAHIKQVRLTN